MSELPLSVQFGLLGLLIACSGFFSGSETALMALNRYRLRHLASKGDPGAERARKLLDRPERLLGLILLGNNLVNILATSLTALITIQLVGEEGVIPASFILLGVVLIFAEVAPKTIAAYWPQQFAFPASWVLKPLTQIFYPVVWIVNQTANTLIRPLGVLDNSDADNLSREELRSIVTESGGLINRRHQHMLLNILDLEDATVSHVMVPRNEIAGIDLNEDWDSIAQFLSRSTYTRLPLYRDSMDNIVGLLHVRAVLAEIAQGTLDKTILEKAARKPYFVPESTSLTQQLLEFQERERRIGLVVDEYGDIQGLITLDDILEEIVGTYSSEQSGGADVIHLSDGSVLVDGAQNIRALNRQLGWSLPTEGPTTLNGLILEGYQAIPDPGTTISVADMQMTIESTTENAVKMVKIAAEPASDQQSAK